MRAVKWLISITLLVVLILLVNSSDLVSALSNLTIEAVIYLALLSVGLIYVSAFKWRLFLDMLGKPIPVIRLFNLYLIGYFVNTILPSYLGGDVARSWYVGKDVGQHKALSATILERYTGIVAMVTLAVLFMWIADGATSEIKLAVICFAVSLIVGTYIALSAKGINLIGKIPVLSKLVKHLEKIQAGFLLAKKNPSLLFKTLALSFCYHILTVINTIAAGYAVGWYDPPVWDLFVVLPLILIIGAIPITPSGLGIQEGAFLYFLSSIGATPAEALGVGIVLRAKTYILALIGWYFWARER